MARAVLIASSEEDRFTCDPVAKALKAKGYRVIYYKSDLVFVGKKTLTMSPQNGKLKIRYDNKSLENESISALWYRRPNYIGPLLADQGRQAALEYEVRRLQEAIWDNIDAWKWLNHLPAMTRANNKLHQLALAQEMGFETPQTVVSSDWQAIEQNLPHEQIILKMSSGDLWLQDGFKALYTTILDKEKLQKVRHTRPFPGIYQNYISKRREWRVTVVGPDVFEASIYTAEDAKDDWRKHADGKGVRFKSEELDPSIKKKCLRYLKKLGLRYGAFDFIEDMDGRIVFLEVNPNGQYGWLEDELGLPISQSMANLLSDIAEGRA